MAVAHNMGHLQNVFKLDKFNFDKTTDYENKNHIQYRYLQKTNADKARCLEPPVHNIKYK